VNVAARLMSFSKTEGIYCDHETHINTIDIYKHIDMGLHSVRNTP
jgi:hypothetical protein